MIEPAFAEIEALTNTKTACAALGRSRATHYRRHARPVYGPPAPRPPRPKPAWTLTETERKQVLDALHSERFYDVAAGQVWAVLLDEDTYLCSLRSMYRILADAGETRERRRHATHPPRVKPHLVARAPNRVWSWDISKLPSVERGVFYDLYEILDIYSRKAVGWRVEEHESADLAVELVDKAIAAEAVDPARLTIHADRGSPMTADDTVRFYARLGVTRSHSRPKTSNDNPYSEAAFRTLKYCPAWPARFEDIDHARRWCSAFFEHYNHDHRHSRLGWHTPASIHDGTATEIRKRRQTTLDAAYKANPLRFRNRPPQAPRLPQVAWINEPQESSIRNK